MANLITIDQLLESVDLDFEPRFVTKDQVGMVWLWEKKPQAVENWWGNTLSLKEIGGKIKISEFENKHWSECLYEVPRKVDPKQELDEMIDKGISGLFYKKYGCWSCDFYPFCNNNVPPTEDDGETIDVERLVLERYSTVYRGIRFYFDNGDQLKAFCKIVESKVDAVNELKAKGE